MSIRRTFELSFPNRPSPEGGCVEYEVGGYFVHATGGPPMESEVQQFFRPPLPDLQPFQFLAVLELSGYKDDLDAFINGLHGQAKVVARAKLDRALSFRRDNELVEAARQAIGLTSEQLDALWVQAAAIE